MSDKKSQLATLWKQLKEAVAVHETIHHDDHLPKARMKQIETRNPVAVGPEEAASGSGGDFSDNVANQKVTVSDNSLRWSCNPDKAIKQEIRGVHQMGGVVKGFSIDPLTDRDL